MHVMSDVGLWSCQTAMLPPRPTAAGEARVAKNKGGNGGKAPQIGFYHMLRDVLVASLNKGQFLVALNGLILIVLILKMPSANDYSGVGPPQWREEQIAGSGFG
jgi:hypothetical protein